MNWAPFRPRRRWHLKAVDDKVRCHKRAVEKSRALEALVPFPVLPSLVHKTTGDAWKTAKTTGSPKADREMPKSQHVKVKKA